MKQEVKTNVAANWFLNGGWGFVVKLIAALILVGVIYARQEARVAAIERSVVSWEKTVGDLTGELRLTRDELVKLRVETAEMRVELKYLAGEWKKR